MKLNAMGLLEIHSAEYSHLDYSVLLHPRDIAMSIL
jgi:hypothetical protein